MFLLPPEYWNVKKTKKKGKGVFTTKDIEAGTIIGDYLGPVVHDSKDESEEDTTAFYDMYYDDNRTIKPDAETNGIHLINHSCTPNTFIYSYQAHTLYFALRHIFKGEELTTSYCLHPIDEDCEPCTHICKCGSDICTGTMHMSIERYKAWRKFDDTRTKHIKIPRLKHGELLQQLSSYPKKIPDNQIYPLFGTVKKDAHIMPDKKMPSLRSLRKAIRETGQTLRFKNLGITVLGISYNHLLCK